ncbi:hypothetical protein FHS68_002131 [Dyadobacter arcticus]|uniref:Uncharacterized protein n=1 Tax=Dyadobacter arcticus TaxID=1078754 RepID=A0ABX0UJ53_9BACT|nr:hypothetical protein [Dyadobacter arcticus]
MFYSLSTQAKTVIERLQLHFIDLALGIDKFKQGCRLQADRLVY